MDALRLLKQDYKLPSGYHDDDVKGNNIIDWDVDDLSRDPKNWTFSKRFSCTLILSGISFLVTLASSMGSGTYDKVTEEFNVSLEVSEMVTSLFLVGFATGAPILAPLCEEVGRLPIYIIGMLLFSCFQIGAATSNNIQSLVICRFFAGFFGTTPLSNAGGSLADLWTPKHMTLAFPFFGVSGFLGPCLGPVIGSYITVSYLGWRWAHYLPAIIGFALSLACFLFMPETYKPIIMDYKAYSIRKSTGNTSFKSIHEIEREGKSLFSIDVFMRPFVFFLTEPIVTSFTFCISITYIVLFSDFESFRVIFSVWGFPVQKTSLPFISMTVGIIFTLLVVTPITYMFYIKKLKKVGSLDKIPPESRLVPLMFCCWGIPISLFWIAWTSYKSISPWPSIISTFFFGVGMMQVFLTTYSYIIDSYGSNSASALSTLTLVRYNVSAGIIHIADPMYNNLGIHWASTLLGFISLLICAIPFTFWFVGPKLRAHSKFAANKLESISHNDMENSRDTLFDVNI